MDPELMKCTACDREYDSQTFDEDLVKAANADFDGGGPVRNVLQLNQPQRWAVDDAVGALGWDLMYLCGACYYEVHRRAHELMAEA